MMVEGPASGRAPRARSGRATLLRWALALLATSFVVWQLLGDPEPLRRLLDVTPELLLAMFGLTLLNQALMSVRFSLAVAQCGGGGVPALVWFRITSVGQMLNLFVPQLGSAYRGFTLKRDYGISYMAFASGLFAFVWLDQLMGLSIAFAVVALLSPSLRFGPVFALPVVLAGIVGLAVAPFAATRLVSMTRVGSGLLSRIKERANTLLTLASSSLRSPALMSRFFLLNLLVTAEQMCVVWLALRSVGASIPLSTLVLFQVLVKIMNQIVITPGNLGITELAFGLLASGSECTVEQGMAASLLMRAVGTVAVVALGVLSGGARVFGDRRALMQAAGGDDVTTAQTKPSHPSA